MTDRMTQSTKRTFKKQWHKDFNFPAQVDSSILNKVIGKKTTKKGSGRNLSNVDTQQ